MRTDGIMDGRNYRIALYIYRLQMTIFVCNNCKWQLLYATIVNDNFCMHYCNWHLLFVLLQVTTIVSTIAVCGILQVLLFCRYYWNWHSCYVLLHRIVLYYSNQNIWFILHLTTFVCTCCLLCMIPKDVIYALLQILQAIF